MSEGTIRLPGLADVAKEAGVSQSTASKALNGRTDVNEETRERVSNVARKLGYSPSPVARALGSGSTSTVGVMTSDLDGRFALPILMGVEDALGADRVLSVLANARGDETRERRLVEMLVKHRVDGIIVIGRQNDPRPSLGELPVPVVYAYSESENPEDISITIDNYNIGQMAADHLSAIGRTRIAHISGEPGHLAAVHRLDGFLNGLQARSLELVGAPLFGLWTEGWGRVAMEQILEREDVDAVFCASDQLARGAVDTLYEHGLRVPEDIAVLGVDNWTVIAESARVPLTTIDLNLKRLGRMAAARLMSTLTGDPQHGVEHLGGLLIHRRSTVPMR